MKTETLGSYRSAHTWAGLTGAWALFIVFFAGGISVFTRELRDWSDPDVRRIEASQTAQLDQLVERVTVSDPHAREELAIALNEAPYPVALWGEDQTAHFEGQTLVRTHGEGQALPEFIFTLHYTLGLPEDAGMYVLGLICILYGFALVSGVVIHARALFDGLFAWRRGRNVKQFWQDVHTTVGVLALPFHFIFAYTGAMFALFGILLASMDSLALPDRAASLFTQASQVVEIPPASGETAVPLLMSQLLLRAKQAAPELAPTFLILHHHGDRNATLEVYGDASSSFISASQIVMSATTGDILGTSLPQSMTVANAATGAMFTLHYGTFAGLLSRWLYLALGLCSALLFYSGALLWLESRRRRREPIQPKLQLRMAQLTVGICVGCCLGIATTFVATHLPTPASLALSTWLRWLYSGVFLVSVAFALCRAPSRAAIELLTTLAIVTAMIPLTNALATGDHLVRSASDGLWRVFFVDFIALLLAVVFASFARAVAHRTKQVSGASVWASTAPIAAES